MLSTQEDRALLCPNDTLANVQLMRKHASLFLWDANHHLKVAMNFLCKLQFSLAGKTVLELGYGQAPVLGVIARGLRAQSYSIEYSSTPWLSSLHIPFYTALHTRLASLAAADTLGRSFNLHAATAWGRSCGNSIDGMRTLKTTSERLAGVPDGSIDVSVSNAVFEHIADVNATFTALARVSRLGSVTCHQVDLRWHRNFSRPWDFLLTPERQWRPQDGLHNGNRLRLQEFLEAARRSGWRAVAIQLQHEPTSKEGQAYATTTLRKLRQCAGCRYRAWPLRDLNGCTANGMPMTSVFFCAEYVGQAAVGREPARGSCGRDRWIQEGYSKVRWSSFDSVSERCS